MPTSTVAFSQSILLRGLLTQARALQFQAPYSHARLARLADQAEYCLHTWPSEHWPRVTRTGDAVPTQDLVVAWAATVKTSLATPAPSSLQTTVWLQARQDLIAALAVVL